MNTSYTFTGVSEGNHTADVKAMDKAGNENTTSVTFGVKISGESDTTPPSVSIISPSDGETITSSNVTVNWTGSDDGSGIDHYEIRMDEDPYVNVGTNVTYEFTDLSPGNHTVSVMAVDVAGNSNTATVTFTYTDKGTISGIVTDENGNPIAGATVRLDTGETTTTDENGHFEMEATGGDHTVWISADGYRKQELNITVQPGQDNDVGKLNLPESKGSAAGIPWLWMVIGVLVIAAIAGILLVKRKKPEEQQPEGSDEANEENSEGENERSGTEKPSDSGEEEMDISEEMLEEL